MHARQIAGRLAESCRVRMFGRNTVASIVTFLLDLLVIWGLVELLGVTRILAAALAYIVAISLFYALSRAWVFPGSHRSMASGFLYFLMNIGIGFLFMMATFWALLDLTEIHYLLARVIASIISGIVIFLLNGLFNFKQL